MSKIGDILENLKDGFMDLRPIRWTRSFKGNIAIMADELKDVGYEEEVEAWKNDNDKFTKLADEMTKQSSNMSKTQKAIDRDKKIIENKGKNINASSNKKSYYFVNEHTYYRSRRKIVKAAKKDLKIQEKNQKIIDQNIESLYQELRSTEKEIDRKEKSMRRHWRKNHQKIKLMKYYKANQETIKKMYSKEEDKVNLEHLIKALKSKEVRDNWEKSTLKDIYTRIKKDMEAFNKEKGNVYGLGDYMKFIPAVSDSNDQNTGHSDQAPQTQDSQTQDPQTQDPQTQNPQTQDQQTQDSQTQDSQTQDPQTQAPQTQDPQTQDSQTQDDKSRFRQGIKSPFGSTTIKRQHVVDAVQDKEIETALLQAGSGFGKINLSEPDAAEQIAIMVAHLEINRKCRDDESDETTQQYEQINKDKEYAIRFGLKVLEKITKGEKCKIYSKEVRMIGDKIKEIEQSRKSKTPEIDDSQEQK